MSKPVKLTTETKREIIKTLRAAGEHALANSARDMIASFRGAVPGNLGDVAPIGDNAKTVDELKKMGILPASEKAKDYPVLSAKVKREVIKTLLEAGKPTLAQRAANLIKSRS